MHVYAKSKRDHAQVSVIWLGSISLLTSLKIYHLSCLSTDLGMSLTAIITFKFSVVFIAGLDGLITFLTPNSRVIPRHP